MHLSWGFMTTLVLGLHPQSPAFIDSYMYHALSIQPVECIVGWLSVSELQGALVFHSTIFSHLHTASHIKIASFTGFSHIQYLLRNGGGEMPGEEARISNVHRCSWRSKIRACVHLGFIVHTLCHYYRCRQQDLQVSMILLSRSCDI